MLEAKTKNSGNESLFVYEKPKANNIIYPAHIKQEAESDRAALTFDS